MAALAGWAGGQRAACPKVDQCDGGGDNGHCPQRDSRRERRPAQNGGGRGREEDGDVERAPIQSSKMLAKPLDY